MLPQFLQLVENAERRDMSPVEHGDTVLALREAGYTQQQIAQALGRSFGWVQNRAMVAGLPEFFPYAVLQTARAEAKRRHIPLALFLEQAILAHARKGLTK